MPGVLRNLGKVAKAATQQVSGKPPDLTESPSPTPGTTQGTSVADASAVEAHVSRTASGKVPIPFSRRPSGRADGGAAATQRPGRGSCMIAHAPSTPPLNLVPRLPPQLQRNVCRRTGHPTAHRASPGRRFRAPASSHRAVVVSVPFSVSSLRQSRACICPC